VIEASAGLALPARVLDDIAARADGVPLFAEELARAVVDAGVVVESGGRYELRGRTADVSIPTTLHGSLMARLDRLRDARPVAQIAATLGREFSFALIEAVADLGPDKLQAGLAQLVAAEILFARGTPPDASYTFKHALLQDTAYESQLRSRRRELHARAAEALEQRFPARVAAEPQVVARHCAEGGLAARAIEHYARAGQQAVARLANAEAVDFYEEAIELLDALPPSASRDTQELSLRVALAGPLSARGYDDPAVLANFARAEKLCDGLDKGPARLPALVGLSVLHQGRGDLARSGRWARELLDVAEALKIAPLRLAGHAMLGAATASYGTIDESCAHYAKVHEIAATTPIPPPVAAFDLDVVAGLSGAYAMSLVLAGRPDQARVQLERGLARARELGHAYTRALALSTGVLSAHFLEDYELARTLADECLEVTRGRGFVQNEAIALALRGWARVMLGDEAGAADHEQGLALLHGSGAVGGVAQFYVAGAEIALRRGRLDEARAHVDRAGEWLERLGQKPFYANVPMLRAELLLAERGDLREAERLLLESLDGWRGLFHSPWMELRSALLLGEVALRGGDRNAARARLADLLARVTEGSDTKRLQDTRRMLAALSR
jgi:tetratricopeptide (TPR) repeat protein